MFEMTEYIIIIMGLMALAIMALSVWIMNLRHDVSCKYEESRRKGEENKELADRFTITAGLLEQETSRWQNASRLLSEEKEAHKALFRAVQKFCWHAPMIYHRCHLGKLSYNGPGHEWLGAQKWEAWNAPGDLPPGQWIEFVEGVTAHASENHETWRKEWRANAEAQTERKRLLAETVRGLLIHCGQLRFVNNDDHRIKHEYDWRLLQFLDHLNILIACDRKDGTKPWTPEEVDAYIGKQMEKDELRRRLMELVTHKNRDYMEIVDKFPVDIVRHLLRMTVAEPAPNT